MCGFGDDAKQIAINCMGLRSAESTERSKLSAWQVNKDLTVNKRKDRTVFDFNPILSMTEKEVFDAIDDAGQNRTQCMQRVGPVVLLVLYLCLRQTVENRDKRATRISAEICEFRGQNRTHI